MQQWNAFSPSPRSETVPQRAVAGFVFRRVLFYLFLAYFCVATIKFPMLLTNLTFWFWAIHTLWLELELTCTRHSALITALHGLSFCGAFDVMAMDTVLLIYNPGLIAARSQIEGLPIWVMWVLNAQLHWLPVLLVCIDAYLSRHPLQTRHNWRVYLHPRKWKESKPLDVTKIVWAALATPIVMGVWLAFFSIEQVYGGSVNMVVMGIVGGVVHICAIILLVWINALNDNAEYEYEPLVLNG